MTKPLSLMLFTAALATASCTMPIGAPTGPVSPTTFTCAARDAEVKAYVAGGGQIPVILTLKNGQKVYIVDTASGYTVIDYPSPWCTR